MWAAITERDHWGRMWGRINDLVLHDLATQEWAMKQQ